jgi:hypothetical protein
MSLKKFCQTGTIGLAPCGRSVLGHKLSRQQAFGGLIEGLRQSGLGHQPHVTPS